MIKAFSPLPARDVGGVGDIWVCGGGGGSDIVCGVLRGVECGAEYESGVWAGLGGDWTTATKADESGVEEPPLMTDGTASGQSMEICMF